MLFCIENLAKHFQFFTLGMLCKEYSRNVLLWLQKDWVKGGLLMGYVVSLWYLELHYSFAYKLNHDLALGYIGVFAIFSFFIYKADFFSGKGFGKLLAFVGKRTLDIYLIHYFLLPTGFLLPECMKGNSVWYVQLQILFYLLLLLLQVL